MSRPEIEKNCSACACWHQPQNADRGECRAQPPSTVGWPKTTGNDWCVGGWIKVKRKVVVDHTSVVHKLDKSCIGFNYAYIRDYPEAACTWLEHAVKDRSAIPATFEPVLLDPMGGLVTETLPIFSEGGMAECDAILRWAHGLPGGENNPEDDELWSGILCYMDDPDVCKANDTVRIALAETHPWAILSKQISRNLAAAEA